MKAKVLIPFRDKVTRKVRKKGAIIDVTNDRFNEISKVGKFLEPVKEETETNI
jgi:hypothetical protein